MSDTIPPPTPEDMKHDADDDYAYWHDPSFWYIQDDVRPEKRDEPRDEWLVSVQLDGLIWIRRAVAAEARADAAERERDHWNHERDSLDVTLDDEQSAHQETLLMLTTLRNQLAARDALLQRAIDRIHSDICDSKCCFECVDMRATLAAGEGK